MLVQEHSKTFKFRLQKFLCRMIVFKSNMYNKLKITQYYLFIGKLTRLTPKSSCFRNPIPQYYNDKKVIINFQCVLEGM